MPNTLCFLPIRHIVFVVYPGFELPDVAGPSSVFNNANRASRVPEERPFYRVVLSSGAGGGISSNSGIVVETRPISDIACEDIDTVLVAGAEREPCCKPWPIRNSSRRCPQWPEMRDGSAPSAPAPSFSPHSACSMAVAFKRGRQSSHRPRQHFLPDRAFGIAPQMEARTRSGCHEALTKWRSRSASWFRADTPPPSASEVLVHAHQAMSFATSRHSSGPACRLVSEAVKKLPIRAR